MSPLHPQEAGVINQKAHPAGRHTTGGMGGMDAASAAGLRRNQHIQELLNVIAVHCVVAVDVRGAEVFRA